MSSQRGKSGIVAVRKRRGMKETENEGRTHHMENLILSFINGTVLREKQGENTSLHTHTQSGSIMAAEWPPSASTYTNTHTRTETQTREIGRAHV